MRTRKILMSLCMLIVVTKANAQDYISNQLAVTSVVYASAETPIESILLNPEIVKDKVASNTLRATGMHNESSTRFVAHFRGKQLHGEWQSFYSNNIPCDEGAFSQNLPDGEWKTYYPDGTLKSVRTYSAEKYLYVKSDLRRNHPKDQRYRITTLARNHHDIDKYFKPDYRAINMQTDDLNMLQRIHINTVSDDNYIAPYKNALHHGAYVNYNEQGAIIDSGSYVNGLRHGIWKEADLKTGESITGFYTHGIKTGQWKHYNSNGTLTYTEIFNNRGEKVNSMKFER